MNAISSGESGASELFVKGIGLGMQLPATMRRDRHANTSRDSDPLLAVRGLVTRIHTRGGLVAVVRGVSLNIGAGEILGLVGETGSGKSMTAASIIGLVPSTGATIEGSVRFTGRDLITMKERDRGSLRGGAISFVPQNARAALNPVLTVRVQMANVWSAHLKLSTQARYRHTLEMLRAVGFVDPIRVAASYPHQLSGGMAQRVVVAIALGTSPDLVIADEPTTGLDATVQLEVLNLFVRLIREAGAGSLLITHDLGVVHHFCDRVCVMYAGQIVEEARVAEFFHQPLHPYSVALLNSLQAETATESFRIAGSPPNPANVPSGCAYRSRCPLAVQLCADTEPDLDPHDHEHLARCHFTAKVRRLTK